MYAECDLLLSMLTFLQVRGGGGGNMCKVWFTLCCTQWFRMKALPASSKELCALGIALGLTSECVVAKAVEFQVIVFTQRC